MLTKLRTFCNFLPLTFTVFEMGMLTLQCAARGRYEAPDHEAHKHFTLPTYPVHGYSEFSSQVICGKTELRYHFVYWEEVIYKDIKYANFSEDDKILFPYALMICMCLAYISNGPIKYLLIY